jgi:hypothetical protein
MRRALKRHLKKFLIRALDMIQIINIIKLAQILRERGNWKLIRRCRRQLLEFIFCRNGLNKRSILMVIPYWLYLLKGLDVLVWRLETFGFLFQPNSSEATRQKLLGYL